MVANEALGHGLRNGGQAPRRDSSVPRLRGTVASVFGCALAALLLSSCYQPSVLPQSEGHIATPATKPTLDDVPPPARTSAFVPAPKPAIKPPTYSVVVSEVPVKELLFALARDSKQNIDIHPGLQGLVSLNAINETLPAILERIGRQVNLRYRLEGNTMVVSPDTAYVKSYRINYVNMTRETTSTIGVSGQIQAGSAGGAGGATSGGGASQGGGQLNASNTVVRTVSNNNFWDTLRDNIRAILNSTRQQTLSADAKAERAELVKQEQDFKIKQLEAASRAGPGASSLASALITGGGSIQQATQLPDDVVINSLTGTLTINATEKQHQLVQQYLDSISQVSQRQVLIEATIAEVTLSDAYQAGIDWSRLPISGGFSVTQDLIGSVANAFTPGSLTIGYTNPTSSIGNISAVVKLLNQFGNTRVLSSPKLMALNNQTALLKVVDNVVYFSIEASQAINQNTTNQVFNTTAQTVPVGVVMSMTPQINDNGQVTLNVRPTITRILDFKNDPNPSLCDNNRLRCISNPVPQIQTREMESVLQLLSGQTAILGGLMQDSVQRDRNSVPGIGNVPNIGEFFSMRNDLVSKSELVIFLRSTVITNPSLEGDELKFFRRFLPQQIETPTEAFPGEKAGVAQ